jgi:ABC-type transporter Mla subunit MlaD
MSLNQELAKTFHISYDLIVPIEVSAGILIFSLVSYLLWSIKIGSTQRLLDKLKKDLLKNDFNGLAAFNEVISKTEDPKIKSLIYETRDNLIEIEGDLGSEYYSLKSYSDIWNARSLVSGRMNLSLFETMPNILIGAGLMITFMFLAWALTDAGGAMGVGSAETKSKAMESLIANAGGKFTSSIIGLFCSLTWSWRAKVILEKLQSTMNEVHAALRKVAPDTAAQAIVRRQHSIFKEMLDESRAQVGQLKRFETDIAVAIAKAIGNELQPSFKTLGTELVQAIKLLTDRIGNMNEDALQKMISQFIDEFRGTSSAEMKEFKNVLTQLAANLEAAGTKIGEDLGAAGTTFGSAAGSLETVITKTQETVVQLDSSLQRAGAVVSEGSDRFELISDKLLVNLRAADAVLTGVDAFIEKIQRTIGMLNDISDTLDDTVEAQKTISIEFRDAIPKMSKALADAVIGISQSSQTASDSLSSIRKELENTKGSIDQTVVSLSSGVDQYTDKVKDLHLILDVKIGEAISKIGSAVMDLTDTIDDLVEALPKK